MAPPKRDEFLDASDSEDDQVDGYGTKDEIAKGGRRAKRRRIDGDDDAASDVDREASDADDAEPREEAGVADKESTGDTAANVKRSRPGPETGLPDFAKLLTKKNLVTTEKAIKRSGVVFLSRIPPFMKPSKLRSLFEPYGAINRMFLAPEDAAAHARRVRAGGNKKRLYTEGWVEFVRKEDAKAACEMLNARIMGGKKRSYYHDDIWSLLYLKGFKWHHLTEQIAAENAERESRMRAEISKAVRENKEFVRNVERAKMLDGMQAKAKKRKAADGGEGPKVSRTFKQVPQVSKAAEAEEQPEQVMRVLSKIF